MPVKAIGSRRLEYQILYALCEAERRRGNIAQAEQYHSSARAVLEYIIEHTPPPYRKGFLNLPLVKEVMN